MKCTKKINDEVRKQTRYHGICQFVRSLIDPQPVCRRRRPTNNCKNRSEYNTIQFLYKN